VGLIPSVVGLTDDDIRVEVGIAVRCASTALPVVAEHRQRGLAVGLLAARRILAEHNGGSRSTVDASELFEGITRALDAAPHAARWAEEFTAGSHVSPRSFQRRSAPAITRLAITGIAEACIPDRDNLLFELLAGVVDDCNRWLSSALPTESAVQPLVSVGPTD
jgi:hypothetical protein